MQQAGPVTLTTDRAPATTATEDTAEDAEHTGKYRLCGGWLQDQGRDEINLSFMNIEQVLGISLPHSARRHLYPLVRLWGTALGRAIRDAGWRAHRVNLADETVTFIRAEAQDLDPAIPRPGGGRRRTGAASSTTERLVAHSVFEGGQQLRIVVPAKSPRIAQMSPGSEKTTRSSVTWRPRTPAASRLAGGWPALQPHHADPPHHRPGDGPAARTQVWGQIGTRDDDDRTLAKLAAELEAQQHPLPLQKDGRTRPR